MIQLSLYPVWIIDIIGSMAMLILASLCIRQVMILYKRDRENALHTYLMWLISALLAFCIFRSLGHLVKHLLLFSDNAHIWKQIAPLSGGLNTVAFIVIFAVTLFFRNILVIMNRMTSDRLKIETTSRQLLALNRNIESVVSDRTRVEMALKLAHQIRNPVMIIGGMLRRLKKTEAEGTTEAAGAEQYKKYCQEMKRQIDRLEALVSGFEEMQPAAHGHFKVLELNEVLSQAIAMVRSEAQNKGIELSFQQSATRLPFQGNQQYLQAALEHLLHNSIEACNADNHIKVSIESTPQGALARIRDDGSGIPKQVLRHIFEPFYSTRDGATGLGLPYVRQIIDEHRGKIQITSIRGKGTTVELLFPSHLAELQEK